MTSCENQSCSCLSFPNFCVLWKRQEQARERINKLCDHRRLDSTSGSRGHLRRSPVLISDHLYLSRQRFVECSHIISVMSLPCCFANIWNGFISIFVQGFFLTLFSLFLSMWPFILCLCLSDFILMHTHYYACTAICLFSALCKVSTWGSVNIEQMITEHGPWDHGLAFLKFQIHISALNIISFETIHSSECYFPFIDRILPLIARVNWLIF